MALGRWPGGRGATFSVLSPSLVTGSEARQTVAGGHDDASITFAPRRYRSTNTSASGGVARSLVIDSDSPDRLRTSQLFRRAFSSCTEGTASGPMPLDNAPFW